MELICIEVWVKNDREIFEKLKKFFNFKKTLEKILSIFRRILWKIVRNFGLINGNFGKMEEYVSKEFFENLKKFWKIENFKVIIGNSRLTYKNFGKKVFFIWH